MEPFQLRIARSSPAAVGGPGSWHTCGKWPWGHQLPLWAEGTRRLPLGSAGRACPCVPGPAASPAPTTARGSPRHRGTMVAEIPSHVSSMLVVHQGLSRAWSSATPSRNIGTEQGHPGDILLEAAAGRDCASSLQSTAREITLEESRDWEEQQVFWKASSCVILPSTCRCSCV